MGHVSSIWRNVVMLNSVDFLPSRKGKCVPQFFTLVRVPSDGRNLRELAAGGGVRLLLCETRAPDAVPTFRRAFDTVRMPRRDLRIVGPASPPASRSLVPPPGPNYLRAPRS